MISTLAEALLVAYQPAVGEATILRGGRILSLDGRPRPRRSDILFANGIIRALGGVQHVSNAEIVETAHLIMPGFVQAHLHLEEALLDRGFVPSIDPWSFRELQLPYCRKVLDRAGLRLSAATALARGLIGGTTAVADGASADARSEAIDAALALGVRLVAPIDAVTRDPTAALDEAQAILGDRTGVERIHLAIWAGDAERTPLARLRAAARLAGARGLPLIVHSGAMPGDRGGILRLGRAGALGGTRLVLCHARAAELAADAKQLAKAGASVVLTPAADLIAGAPPPPLEAFLEAGVGLALGSDTGAARTGGDPFRDLRLLAGVLRGRVPQPASTALEIAARGGARALGLPCGTVEVGRAADLIAIDLETADSEDHETIAARVIDLGSPSRVRTVWIAGQLVAADGRTVIGESPDEAEQDSLRARLALATNGGSSVAKLRARLRSWRSPRRGWHPGRLPMR